MKPTYPIVSLIPWLKRYRPDLELGAGELQRYRTARKADREQKAEDDPWAEFDYDSPQNVKRRLEGLAYGDACKLDRDRKYAEADRVLRKAGVSAKNVEHRRRYIDHRLAQGLTAIE